MVRTTGFQSVNRSSTLRGITKMEKTNSSQKEIPLSVGGQVMLNVVHKELLPMLNKIRELLINIQKCDIKCPLYSRELNDLEKNYINVVSAFFLIIKKIESPDELFKGLEIKQDDFQHIADYFQFQPAISKSVAEGFGYIEIADRTLDRKKQTIQNTRSFLLAVISILIAIIWKG